MTPKLNDPKWYTEMIRLNIDRVSLLSIVAVYELALRHPGLPVSVRDTCFKWGRFFLLRLLDDGLIIPDEVRISWEKTFGILTKSEKDRIIEGVTDLDGHRWD